jgi:hypothetical protein
MLFDCAGFRRGVSPEIFMFYRETSIFRENFDFPTPSSILKISTLFAISRFFRRTSEPGGATPTLQRNAAYFCLSFARLSLAWFFALGRVLT